MISRSRHILLLMLCILMHMAGAVGQNTANDTLSELEDKRDKAILEEVLPYVLQLQAVYFSNDTTNNVSQQKAICLIPEDVQEVFPGLLEQDKRGSLSINDNALTVVLLQAIKEQQFLIDQQNQNNEKQQYQIENLTEEINQLKQQIDKK